MGADQKYTKSLDLHSFGLKMWFTFSSVIASIPSYFLFSCEIKTTLRPVCKVSRLYIETVEEK